MSSLSCAACGLSFVDSQSHGMHLLTRRHKERVGQFETEVGVQRKQPTLQDLRMMIERTRYAKETAIFGSAAVSTGAQRRARDEKDNNPHGSSSTSRYFGSLARDPAPHAEVLAELQKQLKS